MPLRCAIRASVPALLVCASPCPAQLAAPASAFSATPTVSESYQRSFDELMDMHPLPNRVASVSNLVIQRDVARFRLQRGSLYLVSPVGARTVAVVFRGIGLFSFKPGSGIEQQRLARIEKTTALETPVTELVFLFADTTLAELERGVSFGPGAVPGDLKGGIKGALEHLADRNSRTFEPDMMSAFLNGERSDLFYAYIRRQSGGPLMFMLNPNEVEAVRLSGKVIRRLWSRTPELINQFPRQHWTRAPGLTGERLRQADIRRYTIESRLTPTGIGEIGFSASALVEIVADVEVGPWVVFELFEELRVVGADVTRSLQFFQQVYGPAPVKHFYATEIPGLHGEAFPGMVHLSWVTFQNTSPTGDDEVFRAHEVAHQWWGIGVDFVSYHDQWLSEGFSNFSGLWYLQTARNDNAKYFDMLRRLRAGILLRQGEPGPISLGYRVFAVRDDDQNDYATVVYQKGAWVVHMLRILMLDLKTMNEDRFTGVMRDFYRRYEGRRASTDDFRQVVERHVGADMGWFFDQWVNGTAIPRYRVAHRVEPMGDGQFRVTLRVKQENVPEDFQMYVPVRLDLGKDHTARFRVKVKGGVSEIGLPPVPVKPKGLAFNDLDGVLAEVRTEAW